MRSDKGGENVDVARAMLAARGTGRRVFLVGSSVRNQRIERLWSDVFRCVCHFYYALFYEMEDLGILDPIRDPDLYALHYVFLPRINSDLTQFLSAWNHHPMRTEHGLSPLVLWQRGMLSAAPQWQQEILDGFRVPADYGIDTGSLFSSAFERTSVVVPRIDLQLTSTQLQNLHQTYNPLVPSNEGGVNIYVDVRQCIASFQVNSSLDLRFLICYCVIIMCL